MFGHNHLSWGCHKLLAIFFIEVPPHCLWISPFTYSKNGTGKLLVHKSVNHSNPPHLSDSVPTAITMAGWKGDTIELVLEWMVPQALLKFTSMLDILHCTYCKYIKACTTVTKLFLHIEVFTVMFKISLHKCSLYIHYHLHSISAGIPAM